MLSAVAATCFAYSSMVALCQGIKKHQVAVWGQSWPTKVHTCLRLYGWLALLACLYLSADYWGWAMGRVGAFGLVSMTGFAFVLGLAYWPKALVRLGAVAGISAVVLSLL